MTEHDQQRPRATWTPPAMDHIVPVIIQHWKLVALSTLLAVGVTLALLTVLSPRYDVNAKLLIKLGREMSAPATVTDTQQVMPTTKRPEDINSEIEIMKSQHLLEELVHHFGEDYFYSEPAPQTTLQRIKRYVKDTVKAIKAQIRELMVWMGLRKATTPLERVMLALREGLTVEALRKTDVVEVRLRTSDPHAGVEILDKFLELYLQSHLDAYKSPRVKDFFVNEISELERQLGEREREKVNFKNRNEVWSIDEQRSNLLEAQRKLESVHTQTVAMLSGLEAEIASVKAQIDDTYGGARLDTGLSKQLDKLKLELIEKQGRLAGLQATAATERRHLSQLQRGIEHIDALAAELARRDRDITLLERNLLLYSRNLEEARISEAMDLAEISNVSIIAPPAANPTPAWPSLKIAFLAALIVGMGGSLGFIFIRAALRPAVRTRRDVVDLLGVPVLARVNEVRSL